MNDTPKKTGISRCFKIEDYTLSSPKQTASDTTKKTQNQLGTKEK